MATMTIEEVERLRDQVWDIHPIICESARLPTPMLKDVLSKTWKVARKARGSIAFFAEPLNGKTFCTEAIEEEMPRKKPGCGVLIFEMVEEAIPAEGRLLSELLNQIDYAPKIARDLAGKRTQVHRAFLALSGEARHLFLVFDEAQELSCKAFAWLKSIINRLVRHRVKVTVVLFGQVELKEKKKALKEVRSDLEIRFMSCLYQLIGLQCEADVNVLLLAIDAKSEFPAGSGLTYTQLLLPRFFAAGGRLQPNFAEFWEALAPYRGTGRGRPVSISIWSAYMAAFFAQVRGKDGADLAINKELLDSIEL